MVGDDITAATVLIRLLIDEVMVDARIYPRVSSHETTIEKYAQAMQKGDKFPPIVVAKIREIWYLIDGFHRINAALRNGWKQMECEVIPCKDLDEAYIESIKRNSLHGEPFRPHERAIIATNLKESGHSVEEISEILRIPEIEVERTVVRTVERIRGKVARRIIQEDTPGIFEPATPGNHNNHRIHVDADKFSPEMVDALASMMHEEWVSWSTRLSGRMAIPAGTYNDWKTRYWVPYQKLPEQAKYSYREWARKALAAIFIA